MSGKPTGEVVYIKKRGHARHGHHGGAWKVAYADFVTAMMAFFLVMWIVSQGPEVRAGVSAYFRDPTAFTQGGDGLLPGAGKGVVERSNAMSTEDATAALERAAEQLRQALASLPQFAKLADRIDISVTEEGLRIELREAPDDGFFASGSAVARPETVELLTVIGRELAKLTNQITIEGHTDSRPYAGTEASYTNWELSADRANAARRVLAAAGIAASHLDGVRGYADTRLRIRDNPLNPGNRRISIIVRRT